MNMKIGKIVAVSALALAITSTCTAAPLAMGFTTNQHGKSIENFFEAKGNAYEDVTEAYPDSAVNNPNGPSEYLNTCIKLFR